MLVWPLRVLGQRVTTVQKRARRERHGSARCSRSSRDSRSPAIPRELERPRAETSSWPASASGTRATAPVLDGLDLHVAPGESLAARRGDGLGQEHRRRPAGPSLRPGGRPRPARRASTSASCDLADVRRAVALVFEETFLFSESVAENIRVGRPTPRDEDVGERAARSRGRCGVHRRPPDGLRHGARRARVLALRRPAPANRDRPRDPRRPGRAGARRRDLRRSTRRRSTRSARRSRR